MGGIPPYQGNTNTWKPDEMGGKSASTWQTIQNEITTGKNQGNISGQMDQLKGLIQQDVTNGHMTQAQADAITAQINNFKSDAPPNGGALSAAQQNDLAALATAISSVSESGTYTPTNSASLDPTSANGQALLGGMIGSSDTAASKYLQSKYPGAIVHTAGGAIDLPATAANLHKEGITVATNAKGNVAIYGDKGGGVFNSSGGSVSSASAFYNNKTGDSASYNAADNGGFNISSSGGKWTVKP